MASCEVSRTEGPGTDRQEEVSERSVGPEGPGIPAQGCVLCRVRNLSLAQGQDPVSDKDTGGLAGHQKGDRQLGEAE